MKRNLFVATGLLLFSMLAVISLHKSAPAQNSPDASTPVPEHEIAPVQDFQDNSTAVSGHNNAPVENSQANFSIEYEHGLITAKIENIPLERVLSEAQKKTGLQINILDSSILGNKVTLSIQNAEPEHFFQALL